MMGAGKEVVPEIPLWNRGWTHLFSASNQLIHHNSSHHNSSHQLNSCASGFASICCWAWGAERRCVDLNWRGGALGFAGMGVSGARLFR